MTTSNQVHTVTGVAEVEIRISDNAPDDLFTRMESGDLPANLYGTMNEEEVLRHWAYNAIRNGVYDVSNLDGWADMESGIVILDVTDVDDFSVNEWK